MSNLSPQAQKLLMKAYQLRNEGKIEASLKQARAVAKKHAQNLHVLYLLGSLYLEKRDYVKAINFFKQGIKQDQNGHINQGGLGAALYKSGDLEQARDWLEKAHKKAPQEFSHISNLANVYYHLGDIEKARPLLENVFATTPHDIAVAQILSRIYILNEEYGQAKKVLTICANKNPSDPEILSTLSSFLESRAMINEARQINEKIFDLDSDNFRAHLSMYNVASQEGNLEEARAHLAKLALLDPMNIDTLTAAIKTKCQEEIFGDNLEKALDNILSLSDDQQRLTQLNHSTLFNVSHILETQKLYDKSFDVLNMANELKKRENEIFGMTFKQDYFRKYIENLKNFDKWDQLLSEKTGGADDDRMVFICAMPRSGTTLMEQILAAHSQSDGIGESQNLDILKFSIAKRPVSFPPQLDWPEALLSFPLKEKEALAKQFIQGVDKDVLNKDAKKIVEKSIGNFLHVGMLAAILPNSKFIYCRRNRAASGLSIYQQDFANQFLFDTDLEDINFMFDVIEEIMSFWQELLGDRLLIIDYEDLVTETENQAKSIISHIDLNWEAGCLEFYKQKRVIKTASLHQARNKVYASSADRYLNYESYLGPLLG